MTARYKILGQGVNALKIDAPENGSLIISELKIKNASYPTSVDLMCGEVSSFIKDDRSFFEGGGLTNSVDEITLNSDGKVFIGGNFTTVGGETRNRLAKLTQKGTLDPNFNPDVNGRVWAIAVQSDGKIVIGGDFTSVNGTTRNRIARLNADGTLDTGFSPNVNGTVRAVALQPDGKIVFCGPFSEVDGVQRFGAARLNPDGTRDGAFNPNLKNGGGTPGTATTIAIQPDGYILFGGDFRTENTQGSFPEQLYLTRLDPERGEQDEFFAATVNGVVSAITLQSDGKIIVGGQFGQVNGVTRNYIARLNADGTLDTGFNPNPNSSVLAIALQPDGKIVVAGFFLEIAGASQPYLARLNPDGTAVTSFSTAVNGAVDKFLFIEFYGFFLAGSFTNLGAGSVSGFGVIKEYFKSENKEYIVKTKPLSYDEEIQISGGIALEYGQSLAVETKDYDSDTVIIQAYGIEEIN